MCSVDDCTREARARGYCTTHYQRRRLGINMKPPIRTGGAVCAVEGCEKPCHAHGWCSTHYRRYRRNGSPILAMRHWLWTGARSGAGYGHFWDGSHEVLAHRCSYELANGAIPEGVYLDHRCRNSLCVNPSHLRPVTNKQNMEHRSGPQSNNTSGFLGVSWDKERRKWAANVKHNGRQFHVGRFATLTEANAAVVAKRNKLFTHNDLDRQAAN